MAVLKMTRERAARILDQETSLDAYAESEYYGEINALEYWKEDVDEACRMGAAALRKEDADGNH